MLEKQNQGVNRDSKNSRYKVQIRCGFQGTLVTVSDAQGNAICWDSTTATCKKNIRVASQKVAQKVAQVAIEHGVKEVDVYTYGTGLGREPAIKALEAEGIKVRMIKDCTPIPHNGCQPKRKKKS